MSKTPRSFSIDAGLDERLSKDDSVNPSALVNEFLRKYFATGRQTEATLVEQRLDRVETEIDSLEEQLETLNADRQRLKEQLREIRSAHQATLEEAEEVLSGKHDPQNPAVINWADKLDIAPETLLEKVNGNGHISNGENGDPQVVKINNRC